ncbi:MAG: threonine synthase [Nitrososphaerota archaeon]|nr:threonine synthase [Nitrososphaerota archaeon]MDG7024031.1 threonine synthase [Nitrososphaerota archaeon]
MEPCGYAAVKSPSESPSTITGVKCVSCDAIFDQHSPLNTCSKCGSMLSCSYDIEKAKEGMDRAQMARRVKSLWRYREVLPDVGDRDVVTLGEGFTPMSGLLSGLLLKDDGLIPTGSFKARGMSVAVSKAKALGLKKLVVPSAGNAGAALACYAARGGITARVFMPVETPPSIVKECRMYGAEVIQVEGNIGDAGAKMRSQMDGYFDMSTLKEPYRLEGKKTMGYEIAEQTGFDLPDVILYPTGGGTGLIGMWKAFGEMEELGWIGPGRPKMFSVQSASCPPIVDAFAAGKEAPDSFFPDGFTVASGLRVPRPFAGKQILSVLRQSKGGAVKVSDHEIIASVSALAKEGVFACPEGAATLAGYRELLDTGIIGRDERILLYNTGTALKYLDSVG